MAILPEVQNHYGKLKFFIDGHWVDSKSDLVYEDVNPANGDVIAEFPSATDEEIEAAIQSAQRALAAWREVPLRDKARYLFDLRGKFEERFDMPVWVENDGNAAAIGESLVGVGRWAKDFVYMYIATGLGGGVILNGDEGFMVAMGQTRPSSISTS